MSRSTKRPWICDRNPWAKNYANRILRRAKRTHDLANGNAYRKFSCSWNICDYKWLATEPKPRRYWNEWWYWNAPAEKRRAWIAEGWQSYRRAFRK